MNVKDYSSESLEEVKNTVEKISIILGNRDCHE